MPLRRLTLAAALSLAVNVAPAAAHGPPKLVAGPEGSTTDRGATFLFSYEEPAPGQTFECALDASEFAPCTDASMPEGHHVYKDLAPGEHTFRVRRVSSFPNDPLGDPTPAERKWTITAPASGAPAEPPAPPATPAAPVLEPCQGVVHITDAAGDSHHGNPDVLRAWMRRDAGRSSIAIEVGDLGPAIDHTENSRLFWRVLFTAADGSRRFAEAVHRRGAEGATYTYGTADGLRTTKQGDTTGELEAGKPGIIRIDLPDAIAPAGGRVTQPVVVSGEANDLTTSYFDRAPGGTDPEDPAETATGADWPVADCAPAAAPAAPADQVPAPAPAAATPAGFVLDTTAAAVTFGRRAVVQGRLVSAAAGTPVELVDAAGAALATGTTRADGAFALAFRPRRSTSVRVRGAGLTSADVPVTVESIVSLLRPRALAAGGLRFRGRVTPPGARAIEIQQRAGGEWIVVGEGRVRKGRYVLRNRAAGRGVYRAVAFDRAGGTVLGTSRTRTARR